MPPTLNLEDLESPEFGLDHVVGKGRDCSKRISKDGASKGVQIALTNSFGFGGTNASLVFKKIN